MELNQIQTDLQQADFQYRLKAIAALKDYAPDVAVPFLRNHIHDPEFLVRSFVAMGLGKQKTAESFAALLEMMKFDNTPNVRAEAANSLSLFGQVSASHLVETFFRDDHWLVQRTILAVMVELDCPEELLEICVQALADEDATVQQAAVDALGTLANTRQHYAALSQILALKTSDSDKMRMRVAYALKHFDDLAAKTALAELRQDPSYQVVGAALEDLAQ
ncbi:MAG: HEAT repeat domain-containing protein [Leptodesmis sp.]|jgi:HEAT repeat protein|uniref:HEAT repeat domain-containing protein n=1 Tax=Leptodesmis sp. TaxID=3100501 RepID=UPI003D136B7E